MRAGRVLPTTTTTFGGFIMRRGSDRLTADVHSANQPVTRDESRDKSLLRHPDRQGCRLGRAPPRRTGSATRGGRSHRNRAETQGRRDSTTEDTHQADRYGRTDSLSSDQVVLLFRAWAPPVRNYPRRTERVVAISWLLHLVTIHLTLYPTPASHEDSARTEYEDRPNDHRP